MTTDHEAIENLNPNENRSTELFKDNSEYQRTNIEKNISQGNIFDNSIYTHWKLFKMTRLGRSTFFRELLPQFYTQLRCI